MKCFKQFLLETQRPDAKHFFNMGVFNPNGRLSSSNSKIPQELPKTYFDAGIGGSEIEGYFGIKSTSSKADSWFYTGEATTFGHVGPVWNKGSQFNADGSGDASNHTFLQVKSERITDPKKNKGTSFVISRVNHKGEADEDIHHVFIGDNDQNRQHNGLSDVFAMKPDAADELIDAHLATELQHYRYPGADKENRSVEEFHSQ